MKAKPKLSTTLNKDREYTTDPSNVPKFPGEAGIDIAAVEITNKIND